MASHAAGNAVPASFIAGIVAFMLAVALGRFAALTLRSTLGRGMLMLLFACPAAFAGLFVTGPIGRFAGVGGFVMPFALSGALFCAPVRPRRLRRPGSCMLFSQCHSLPRLASGW